VLSTLADVSRLTLVLAEPWLVARLADDDRVMPRKPR